MTVLSAHGTEINAYCSRCGSAIKYVYDYNGKPYGSKCIERVTGIAQDFWVVKDGKFDEQASRQREAEQEATRLARIEANKALEEKREGIRAANRKKYAELINVLNNASRYRGDFCSEMAHSIETDGFSTELYEGILSPRCFQIVREIWGKTTGGRMNSKAYKAAVTEFDKKYDEDYYNSAEYEEE